MPKSAPWRAKLTTEQVQDVRRRSAAGVPLSRLSKELGVGWGTIRDIAEGKTWKHLPWPDGVKAPAGWVQPAPEAPAA